MKKIFFDFFPIIIFFVVYKIYNIYYATAALMISFTIQIIFQLLKNRKVDPMHIVTFIVIILFGGLTLYFHNDKFIQWKVTVINWLFALILMSSQIIFKKNLLKALLSKNMVMKSDKHWSKLNTMWIYYFILLGGLNLYIAYFYSLSAWVNFKTFGLMGITLLFIIIQSIYLYKHIDDTK